VQRLFTSFPGGSPGFGLLLLRVSVAVALFAHGATYLVDSRSNPGKWAIGALVALTGGLLVLGVLTPLSSAVAAATALLFGTGLPTLLIMLTATALALLGPGAFSVDAALFGRREISFPRAHQRPG
jgi:hypothetical protein